MNEAIQKLQELQKVLQELARVEAERDGLPARREALEERRRGSEERLQTLHDRMEERDRDRRKNELDLKALEDRLQHYKDQLMEVKTNKEFHALQHEIEMVKGQISDLETMVLTEMEEADEDTVKLEKAGQERDRIAEIEKRPASAVEHRAEVKGAERRRGVVLHAAVRADLERGPRAQGDQQPQPPDPP